MLRRQWSWLKSPQWHGKWWGCAHPQYSHYLSVCRARRWSIFYYSPTWTSPWMAGHRGEPSPQLRLHRSILLRIGRRNVSWHFNSDVQAAPYSNIQTSLQVVDVTLFGREAPRCWSVWGERRMQASRDHCSGLCFWLKLCFCSIQLCTVSKSETLLVSCSHVLLWSASACMHETWRLMPV